jgi:hypothetical protein
MRELSVPAPAYFFVAMLSRDIPLLARAKDALADFFGPAADESAPSPFAFTDYYENEMGKGLLRQFVFFARPRDPSEIVDAKKFSVMVEASLGRQEGGRMARSVNIDPGYVTRAKLVLASRKDFSHRIYLGRGVFAEVTLTFVDGTYRPHSYTFPEYRDQRNIAVFCRMRERCFAPGQGARRDAAVS